MTRHGCYLPPKLNTMYPTQNRSPGYLWAHPVAATGSLAGLLTPFHGRPSTHTQYRVYTLSVRDFLCLQSPLRPNSSTVNSIYETNINICIFSVQESGSYWCFMGAALDTDERLQRVQIPQLVSGWNSTDLSCSRIKMEVSPGDIRFCFS
ncbi:hypothetical protein FKM82_027697 [Ascaphus truei]